MKKALTQQVLQALVDLRPRTTEEVLKALRKPKHLTADEFEVAVRGAISNLRTRKLVASEPVCYFITPEGVGYLNRVPEQPSHEAIRRRMLRAKRRFGIPRKKPGRKPKIRVDQPAANEDALALGKAAA